MSKTKGSRSKDYDSKRLELLRKIGGFLMENPTQKASMRQIATACDVSMPTLIHYFQNRESISHAWLEQCWKDARHHLQEGAQPKGTLAHCIKYKLQNIADAFMLFGLDKLHIWGLTEGLGDTFLGPSYLQFFLEPTLQACEAWLSYYKNKGDIDSSVDIRFAAISLISPLIILLMHQHALSGSDVRPADIQTFINQHAKRFLFYIRK
jgi:AcrR family transcriptional regulator